MAATNYPIICIYDVTLRNIQKKLYDWMLNEVKVNFVFNNHISCCEQFETTVMGNDPERKIILIHPDLNWEATCLVYAFNNGFPALAGNASLPTDRAYPFCGVI